MLYQAFKQLFVTCALAVFTVSCASDGRTLEAPDADQTTTTRAVTTSALSEDISESGFSLSSPDFNPAGEVPQTALCSGGALLPKLEWDGPPADTQEFAITLADYTNFEEPLLLWLGGNIAPNITEFDIANPPEGFVETQNDYGSAGFGSPCIEDLTEGDESRVRDLQFRVYALAGDIDTEQGGHGNDSWTEIRAQAMESAAVLMRYFPESTTSEDPETEGLEEIELLSEEDDELETSTITE